MMHVAPLLILVALLTACVSPTITGPSSFAHPPQYGWTKAEVRAHWGIPYRSSWYEAGRATYETWLYRRSYFVSGAYGSHIEAEYASVNFVDGKVVGIAY